MLQRLARPILASAGAGFDVAVVRIAQELAKRASKRGPTPTERLAYLEGVAERYAEVDRDAFYAAPPPIARMHERFVREMHDEHGEKRGSVTDVSWASRWIPARPEHRDRYLAWHENTSGHARLFRHATPRPTLVCIHGYRAGTFSFEERAWATSWLYGLGLDVALFTLPFHALRAPAGRKRTPLFPTADVARTNEALGQAIWDLRALVEWLGRHGAPSVGLAGMSLGGYTTALASTAMSELAFAIPFIPLADLTDVVVEHEAMRGTVVPSKLVDAGKRALDLVRPLARKPVIPGDRMLVVVAEGDRITHPTHAQTLARHFGAEMARFPGAHLLQFGRREGFSAIARFLSRLGYIQPR